MIFEDITKVLFFPFSIVNLDEIFDSGGGVYFPFSANGDFLLFGHQASEND